MKQPWVDTAVVAVLMMILATAASADAGCENGRYCTCELPHRSSAWTDDLYFMLQRQVLLDFGYVEGDAEACGEPRLAAAPGVDEPLGYHKVLTKEKKIRCLELGREATRDGRTRFAIYGVEVDEDGGGASDNPELPDVKESCLEVRDQIDDIPLRAPRDHYLTYQLSYVEADRALTLLEALGYSVARYAEKENDDGISFQPLKLIHGKRRPVVVEMLDSAVTSLVTGSTNVEANGTLAGGSPLPGVTSGVPEQRLLIVYDADEKESVEALVNLLSEHVDLPARQILFEALVIEVSRDHLRDLGFTLTGMKDGQSISFDAEAETPFMASFTRPSIKSVLGLTATLEAVVAKGEGSVISRPSVMVLDGRQARIKIADEIPYLQYVTDDDRGTTEGRLFSTDFLTAGIILNLRPRANHDGSEITTQVETIISSASPAGVTPQGLPIAPTVQSREVQTFVRVANDTPFIIGGLLAQDRQRQTTGVPWLSEIPVLGWLFKRHNRSDDRREVMVMITPHVIEPDDRNFGYAIARGSDLFDAFNNDLFRNIYRIRPADVFDLDFLWQGEKLRLLRQSVDACALEIASTGSTTVPDVDPALLVDFVRSYFEQAEPEPSAKVVDQQLDLFDALDTSGSDKSRDYLAGQPAAGRPPNDAVASFLQVLEEGVPGEEILAARMLLHTLENPRFDAFVGEVGNVGLFVAGADDRLRLRPLSELAPGPGDCDPDADPTCTLVLTIPPSPSVGLDPEFFPPLVTSTWETLADDEFITELRKRNADGQRAILLNYSFGLGGDDGEEGPTPWERLRYALLMKRLLEVNERPDLLTLRGYHVGRELVIPTRDELGKRRHVIDRRTAEFFYHGYDYYKAFEWRFQEKTSELASLMQADPACWRAALEANGDGG